MAKRSKPSRAVKPAVASRWDPRALLAGGLIVLLALVAFWPAVKGQFIWDDNDYVSENPTLRTGGGLVDIWLHPTRSPQYYPMVFTTFWVEYQMWGANPRGYHVTNILLHAANAVLLWRVLRRLGAPGAYVAGVIFAVHPVMVESVAWITERKNTLSLLFYLLAAWAYLGFARVKGPNADDLNNRINPPEESDAPPKWWLYGLSLGLFVLALLSKTVTASLPAALALVIWWKRGRVTKADWGRLAPFFALGLLAGLATALLERAHVGASGAEWHYSLAQRVLIAGRAVWFYAGKIFGPKPLSFVYEKWAVDTSSVWQWLYPLGALAVVGLFWWMRTAARGPLVAILFFGGTLIPALGFVNVYPMRYTFVADHYQYHAAIGLIALVAGTLGSLHEGLSIRDNFGGYPGDPRFFATTFIAVLLLPLFRSTWQRSGVYADQKTLWTDTVRKSPGSWMAWTNLGHAARAERDFPAAADAYRKALGLAPDVADTRFNAGLVHYDAKDFAAAAGEFRKAIEIEPRYTDAYSMLGYCLRRLGQVEEAIAEFRKAIALEPEHWRARYNLALAYKEKKDYRAAAVELQRSLAINPYHADAYFELADCLRQVNEPELAIMAMEELVRLEPGNAQAHWGLAALLRGQGRTMAADAHRARALAIDPGVGGR